MKLRVLTYNIHKGFSTSNSKFVLKQIKASITEAHADLVCLQEVVGDHTAHAEKWEDWPDTSQFEYLADETWSHFAYGKNAVYTEGHHGNAILSKFPILSWENQDVSFNQIERRGLLHTVIELPHAFPLHAFSLHLGLFEKDRTNQLNQLCDRILALVPDGAPLIIAGDFNDWRMNASDLLVYRLGLKEAFLETKGKHARSFPSIWPALSLDRIYYRGLQCEAVKVLKGGIWNQLSDHLPLMAEFEIPS